MERRFPIVTRLIRVLQQDVLTYGNPEASEREKKNKKILAEIRSELPDELKGRLNQVGTFDDCDGF